MMRSSQTTVQFREDGCRYRTVIEETCKVQNDHGEKECERIKKVFRKCPNDSMEKELDGVADNKSSASETPNRYREFAHPPYDPRSNPRVESKAVDV